MDLPVAQTADSRTRELLRALPAPEPSAGMQAYRREYELALAASPRKRENYEKYRRATRRADIDYLPIKLDIENVSRCNFRCTMCVVSDWEKGQRGQDMSVASFKKLIDEQYGLLEIKLQGIGEPTMQRDHLFEMIRYARAQHIWVRTTTNASLLHLKGNFRKLIDADPNEVQISFDGADKETFESIRRGAVFEQIQKNCTAINAYCAEKGVVRTKMWTVVQQRNQHQLRRLVEMAAEMGFRHQTFALNLTDWGLAEWNTRNNGVSVQDQLTPEMLYPLVDLGASLGIRVSFWNVNEKYELGHLDTLCPWPFERAYISSDLRVVPCCYIGNPDVYEVGKGIAKGSFAEVWQGEDFREFRRAHLEGRLPDICKGCYKAAKS